MDRREGFEKLRNQKYHEIEKSVPHEFQMDKVRREAVFGVVKVEDKRDNT